MWLFVHGRGKGKVELMVLLTDRRALVDGMHYYIERGDWKVGR